MGGRRLQHLRRRLVVGFLEPGVQEDAPQNFGDGPEPGLPHEDPSERIQEHDNPLQWALTGG